jgi:hypothetical protein
VKYIKRINLIIFFCLVCQFLQAQFGNKNIALSVEVKYVDSQYVMIPKLKILDDTTQIQIHKRLYYGSEYDQSADCMFYLRKLVGKNYINMYIEAIRERMLDDLDFTFRNFTKNDSLNDTINLQYYFPLEAGEYRLNIQFNYYSQGEKHTL